MTLELVIVRTKGGRFHKASREPGRPLMSKESCNLDQTRLEVVTFAEIERADTFALCRRCFPGGEA